MKTWTEVMLPDLEWAKRGPTLVPKQ